MATQKMGHTRRSLQTEHARESEPSEAGSAVVCVASRRRNLGPGDCGRSRRHGKHFHACESVETREQIDALIALGCQVGQGFYYAKPMPAEDFARILEKGFLK